MKCIFANVDIPFFLAYNKSNIIEEMGYIMNTEIKAIFFDLGDTLRVAEDNPAYVAQAKQNIADLIGVKDMDGVTFYDTILAPRYEERYRAWVLKYMCEAPEDILWTRFLCPEYDHDRLKRNAIELTWQMRQAKTAGPRHLAAGAKEGLAELKARGYKLGVISDLIGCKEVEEWLDEDKLRDTFVTVQQSSVTFIRKPNPAIFYYALREAGVAPENACYVGDNLQRDIIGAKVTDFGMTIAVNYKKKSLKLTEENMPNGVITEFPQLLDIFPGAPAVNVNKIIKP